MDDDARRNLVPGARVRVIQQIAGRNFSWNSVTEGVVIEYALNQTGSWFAHSRDDRLWLDRLVIRKDDGEISSLNLDAYSVVEVLGQEVPKELAEKKSEAVVPA